MKVCTKCTTSKEEVDFAKRSKSSDGLSSWCKLCFAVNAATKYKNDPEERARKKRNQNKSVGKIRDALWDYLSKHPCVDCDNADPRVLEFDHRDEALKTRNVSDMFNWSWEAVLREIEKCDIRCANCHRIRTQEQFGTWRSTHVASSLATM